MRSILSMAILTVPSAPWAAANTTPAVVSDAEAITMVLVQRRLEQNRPEGVKAQIGEMK